MLNFLNSICKEQGLPSGLTEKVISAWREAYVSFQDQEEITAFNQLKILQAFQKQRVSDFHLNGSTGYGYGDTGREALEGVYKEVFKAETALVRSHIVSGTHALGLVLYGNLKHGDKVLSITGKPYDTLYKIFGEKQEPGTLSEAGIHHRIIPMLDDAFFDREAIRHALVTENYAMVCIQRSRGYASRKSVTIEEIREIAAFVKTISPDTVIFVDNCYGEFVETQEPLEAGADVIAGSLIKNPGGGLAIRGGYIAGKEELVTRSAYRLTAPGIHQDVGSALDFNRTAFQGLFMAPLTVEQSLKGAIFAAALFSSLGFSTSPASNEKRTDIVQRIVLEDPSLLEGFCRAIQASCPLDAFVRPTPSQLPGYADPVIMAGGTFIQGSSIELSVDGPMRPPFAAYLQGGLSLPHILYAVIQAVKILDREE